MKLSISILTFLFLFSCEIKNIDSIINNDNKKKSLNQVKFSKYIKYHLGEIYYIEGVKHIPSENYNYDEIGIASFYGKELHNFRTINNDLNKVTELLGRHKTLPIPSIVKITNIDNGLSLIIKINDRMNDNSSIIQVSRKTAQLLKFYSKKITKVRLEILEDPSKQMKIVTNSMSKSSFDDTISSAPTISVSISNLVETKISNNNLDNSITDEPIKLGFENITNQDLFLKIFDFESYDNIKKLMKEIDLNHKFSTQNEGTSYTLIIGPLENKEANNLVLTFISKGYNNHEFILE